jgi:hypothetical protein
VPASTGLLIRVEKSGATKNAAGAPCGEVEPGWGVAKIKRCGADAVKLLAQFEPGEPDSAERNFEFTKQMYNECIAHDILFLLEPLHFAYNGEKDDSPSKLARKAHQLRCQLDGREEAALPGPDSFAVEVEPSLKLPAQVGNIYTGSLYLALLSLLHAEARQLENQRIGLFSYGSGCAAEFFAGRVRPGAGDLIEAMDVAAPLRERHRLTIAEYEQLRANDAHGDQRPATHDSALVSGEHQRERQARFCGIDVQERRVYSLQ